MKSMRILLVSPVAPPYGGMALQAAQLERLLRTDGNSVDLFPSNFPCPKRLDIPFVRTIVRLALIGPKLWRAMAKAECVHIMACSWFYFFAVVFPAVVIGRLRSKRVVVNYRGGEAGAFFDRFGMLVKPVIGLAHQVTAPSDFLANLIMRHFQTPVAIVPNLINRGHFAFRRRERFQPKLLVTRHLENIYDIESVLKAFRVVREAMPEATLAVAGSGSQKSRLQALVAEWGLDGVTFLGSIAHAGLPAIYEQCDIYVNASRVDNFPGALLEASSAGLAVVSTDAGGIPFLYEGGKSAWLAGVGDWRGLADGVLEIAANPDLGQRLVNGASELLRRSEWPQVRRELYRAYGAPEELVSGGPEWRPGCSKGLAPPERTL